MNYELIKIDNHHEVDNGLLFRQYEITYYPPESNKKKKIVIDENDLDKWIDTLEDDWIDSFMVDAIADYTNSGGGSVVQFKAFDYDEFFYQMTRSDAKDLLIWKLKQL